MDTCPGQYMERYLFLVNVYLHNSERMIILWFHQHIPTDKHLAFSFFSLSLLQTMLQRVELSLSKYTNISLGVKTSIKFLGQRIYAFLIELGMWNCPPKNPHIVLNCILNNSIFPQLCKHHFLSLIWHLKKKKMYLIAVVTFIFSNSFWAWVCFICLAACISLL